MLADTAFLHFLVQLNGYVLVSRQLIDALHPIVFVRQVKKGSVLVERGKRQRLVWFLHSGCAKEVTFNEVTLAKRVSWFFFASDFVFAYPGFFAGEPAWVVVELLEDTVLLEMGYADLVGLVKEFPEISLLIEKIRAGHERARVAHAGDLINLSARERFDKYFTSHKGLFNIAKHKDIASFLAIKDDGFHRFQ